MWGMERPGDFLPSAYVSQDETKFHQISSKPEKNQFPDFQVFLNPMKTVVEPGAWLREERLGSQLPEEKSTEHENLVETNCYA